MRQRDNLLKTGDLLVPRALGASRGVLFLVNGSASLDPLRNIHLAVLRCVLDAEQRFEWQAVDGPATMSLGASGAVPTEILRLEAVEFAELVEANLDAVLKPALERLFSGQRDLFPVAGGAVGTMAQGVQFLDRRADLQRLREDVVAGRHALLVAPRRTGKTSLLLRFVDELPATHRAVFVDADLRSIIERTPGAEPEPVLSWMQEAFPIRRKDGQFTVASALFRRWWRRQVGASA